MSFLEYQGTTRISSNDYQKLLQEIEENPRM